MPYLTQQEKEEILQYLSNCKMTEIKEKDKPIILTLRNDIFINKVYTLYQWIVKLRALGFNEDDLKLKLNINSIDKTYDNILLRTNKPELMIPNTIKGLVLNITPFRGKVILQDINSLYNLEAYFSRIVTYLEKEKLVINHEGYITLEKIALERIEGFIECQGSPLREASIRDNYMRYSMYKIGTLIQLHTQNLQLEIAVIDLQTQLRYTNTQIYQELSSLEPTDYIGLLRVVKQLEKLRDQLQKFINTIDKAYKQSQTA